MTRRDFDAAVESAIARIPRRFRLLLQNVVFVIEDEPPERGLLGLYEGRPLSERSVSDPVRFPDKITIYQKPHERAARSRAGIQRLVDETVWHEVGHYFGLSEKEVLRMERRWRREKRLTPADKR